MPLFHTKECVQYEKGCKLFTHKGKYYEINNYKDIAKLSTSINLNKRIDLDATEIEPWKAFTHAKGLK